jgi:hypothetical protein
VVTDVIDNLTVVEKLLTITRVSIGGVAVLAMMLFVALFVIVNTIRIAVHARRDDDHRHGHDWFVSWLFILEGSSSAPSARSSRSPCWLWPGAGDQRDGRSDILPVCSARTSCSSWSRASWRSRRSGVASVRAALAKGAHADQRPSHPRIRRVWEPPGQPGGGNKRKARLRTAIVVLAGLALSWARSSGLGRRPLTDALSKQELSARSSPAPTPTATSRLPTSSSPR